MKVLRNLREFLRSFWECLRSSRKKEVSFYYTIGPVTMKKPKRKEQMTIIITNEQKVKVTLHPVTAGGAPAELDEPPEWTVQSGECTLEVAEDGLSADIISGENPGNSEVLITADADLGQGVQTISDALQIQVTGAQAVSLGITVGEPEPKDTPPE